MYFLKRATQRPLQPDSAALDIAEIALVIYLVFLSLRQEKVLHNSQGPERAVARHSPPNKHLCQLPHPATAKFPQTLRERSIPIQKL